MVGPFKRTVVFDITAFPSTVSRVAIAKLVYSTFDYCSPADSVESIQFVPGGRINVTFRSCEVLRESESFSSIEFGGVDCPVVKPGPRLENVLVFHYPFESDSSALRRVFGSFGEVHEVSMQHYPDIVSVATGTRIVRMVRKTHIPRSVVVDDTRVKVWYRGQPVECDVCGKGGHVSKDCPLKGKCRRCLQPGHLARHCNNAPRAWDTVRLLSGSSVAPLDPTPAEAAVAAGPVPAPAPAPDPVPVPDPDPVDPADLSASEVGDDEFSADCESAGAAAPESPVASQSVLAESSSVVDPPVAVADSASADADVGVDSKVVSLPDGQVVNTPWSDSPVVLSDPVVTVIEEGVNVLDDVRLIPREFLYRRNRILPVDWRRRKVRVQIGSGSKWVDGIAQRRV